MSAILNKAALWTRIVLFTLLFPPMGWAASPQIQKLEVALVQGEIRGSFVLAGGLSKKIEQEILDGLQKELYYYLILTQKHEDWFDEEITAKTIHYTMKYDTLKKIYTVRQQIEGQTAEQTFDALPSMWGFVSKGGPFFVAPGTLLKPNHRYFLRAKAQMKVSHVPLHLDRFLFFVPFLEMDTPWKQSRSIYAVDADESRP
jgi:hypothetical protein